MILDIINVISSLDAKPTLSSNLNADNSFNTVFQQAVETANSTLSKQVNLPEKNLNNMVASNSKSNENVGLENLNNHTKVSLIDEIADSKRNSENTSNEKKIENIGGNNKLLEKEIQTSEESSSYSDDTFSSDDKKISNTLYYLANSLLNYKEITLLYTQVEVVQADTELDSNLPKGNMFGLGESHLSDGNYLVNSNLAFKEAELQALKYSYDTPQKDIIIPGEIALSGLPDNSFVTDDQPLEPEISKILDNFKNSSDQQKTVATENKSDVIDVIKEPKIEKPVTNSFYIPDNQHSENISLKENIISNLNIISKENITIKSDVKTQQNVNFTDNNNSGNNNFRENIDSQAGILSDLTIKYNTVKNNIVIPNNTNIITEEKEFNDFDLMANQSTNDDSDIESKQLFESEEKINNFESERNNVVKSDLGIKEEVKINNDNIKSYVVENKDSLASNNLEEVKLPPQNVKVVVEKDSNNENRNDENIKNVYVKNEQVKVKLDTNVADAEPILKEVKLPSQNVKVVVEKDSNNENGNDEKVKNVYVKNDKMVDTDKVVDTLVANVAEPILEDVKLPSQNVKVVVEKNSNNENGNDKNVENVYVKNEQVKERLATNVAEPILEEVKLPPKDVKVNVEKGSSNENGNNKNVNNVYVKNEQVKERLDTKEAGLGANRIETVKNKDVDSTTMVKEKVQENNVQKNNIVEKPTQKVFYTDNSVDAKPVEPKITKPVNYETVNRKEENFGFKNIAETNVKWSDIESKNDITVDFEVVQKYDDIKISHVNNKNNSVTDRLFKEIREQVKTSVNSDTQFIKLESVEDANMMIDVDMVDNEKEVHISTTNEFVKQTLCDNVPQLQNIFNTGKIKVALYRHAYLPSQSPFNMEKIKVDEIEMYELNNFDITQKDDDIKFSHVHNENNSITDKLFKEINKQIKMPTGSNTQFIKLESVTDADLMIDVNIVDNEKEVHFVTTNELVKQTLSGNVSQLYTLFNTEKIKVDEIKLDKLNNFEVKSEHSNLLSQSIKGSDSEDYSFSRQERFVFSEPEDLFQRTDNEKSKNINFADSLQEFSKNIARNIEFLRESSPDIPELVPAHKIIDTIVKRISQSVFEGKSEISVELAPANLGKLVVKILSEEGKINANIEVKNSEVKQIVEIGLTRLKEELSQNGVKVEQIDVSLFKEDATSKNNHERFFNQPKQNKFSEDINNYSLPDLEDEESMKSLGYNTLEYIV